MAETRHVHVDSSLKDKLLLQRMRGVEELGRPFKYRLDLLSTDPDLKMEDLVGDKMTVVLTLPDGERHFNGIVSRFGVGGTLGRYTRYTAMLRPNFWLLTRASDSKIYKKMSVPQIVKDVVGKFGLGDVEDGLQHTYVAREYRVQYRETYFDFLSRLMEEEGIYYFFKHEKDKHTMVLCDDKGSHKPAKGFEKVPFIDPEENAHPRDEHFSEWDVEQELQSAAFV